MPNDRLAALAYGAFVLALAGASGARGIIPTTALMAGVFLIAVGCWCALGFLRWTPGALRVALAGPPSVRTDLVVGLCTIAIVRLAAGALSSQVPEMFQLAIALLMASLTGAGIILFLELLVNETRAMPPARARPSTRHRAS